MPSHDYDPPGRTCSDGWKITGYFLPAEIDFGGAMEQVTVENVGKASFPVSFIQAAKMEGWALTRQGWFLGWSGGRWLKSDSALNAHGQPLKIGSSATDPKVIPAGTEFLVVSAPSPWNTQVFVADDTGGLINGKHIDIYCGAGSSADAETSRVTAANGRVCI